MDGSTTASTTDCSIQEQKSTSNHGDPWPLTYRLEDMLRRDRDSGFPPRNLGVTWSNLTVKAKSAESAVNENIFTQFDVIGRMKRRHQKRPPKEILHKSHGCVKPGEMLLVLGRPGSGCTTLLNMLANRRAGYDEIEGDVWYGNMRHDEASHYKGQIIMNTEEEIFFPTLTVGQTLDFATKLKVPQKLPTTVRNTEDYRVEMKEFLLESLGISHTKETKVGDPYIRGVSGGERKRVSILECLASSASIYCWDNSTRGLDASSALDWAKAMRAMADVYGKSMIVTLYQAGNDIFQLFDKVLVLDEGKQIYYGPANQAQKFMEDLGFIIDEGAKIGDFLTGITVPTERQVRPGYESVFPRDAETILQVYDNSSLRAQMATEYQYPTSESAQKDTGNFKDAVSTERHRPGSVHTAGFTRQVRACVVRQYQILLGDKKTLAMKQGSTLIQALVAGSLYYQATGDSTGLFLKGGAMFWSILYNSMSAMSEVVDSFSGRLMVIKHGDFAFHHPAAFCVGQITADIPISLVQVTIWSLVVYFMVGLQMSVSGFFTYWVVLFASIMSGTAIFRAVGATFRSFDSASKISGYVVTVMAMYAGYQIQYSQMHPWLGWLYWLNPVAYAFDSLMSNEFNGQTIPCAGVNLIPRGELYSNVDSAHQSCAGVRGAEPRSNVVLGTQYLSALSYSQGHLWRNFGILWAWWAFYVAITILATIRWRDASASGATLLIPREKLAHHRRPHNVDEESQAHKPLNNQPTSESTTLPGTEKEAESVQLVRNTSVFTWKNLTYTVSTPSGPRVLLENVNGWVKPGMLGALMGASGAGKTTLLDVLAQRKTEGRIEGSIMVDGRPLSLSFQRSAGYCEQLDVHEPYATVREALEFSALLRQPSYTPRAEKLRYVDVILDLLDLHSIADTLIGNSTIGGLNVEQRKRVTIGVELVAKPSILIFLDEPTSGLDGQAAFNTVRFLRRLADHGQAILVTIHQPSAQLFYQFDTLLLLARGGKTVYFGDIGPRAQTLKDYFGRHGAPCPAQSNPADHVIDVVSGRLSSTDWHQVWLQSPEFHRSTTELNTIIEESASRELVTRDDGQEYAMPLWDQTKIVLHRMNLSLFRNSNYVNNKIYLHIGLALFNGFSYWMIGNSVNDLQLRIFTIFVFMYVAPGVVNQLQPLFIERRDIYDTREKKSRMYSWKAFVTGLIVSEFPYLCVCGVLYFVCWYYTVGFPAETNKAGASFLVVLLYEFFYTGMGQFIAAYSPNAVFASLVNPLVVGILVSFCGILVPYGQIVPFWRYWMYYLNPTNYLVGSLLTFTIFDVDVQCTESEYAVFDPPANATCGEYLAGFLNESDANLVNPEATHGCRVCSYTKGSGYLETLNLNDFYYGWRDVGIFVIFVFSSYGLVYLFMKPCSDSINFTKLEFFLAVILYGEGRWLLIFVLCDHKNEERCPGWTTPSEGAVGRKDAVKDGTILTRVSGFGRQVEAEQDQFGTQGRKNRIKKVAAEKLHRTYRGRRAYTLFLQVYQFILWKQCYALVQVRGFPEQFESIVRDLWTLRLETYSDKIKEIPEEDDQPEMFSSQPNTDVESEPEDFKPKSKWPRLIDTVGLCYLAALLMRIPVSICDMHWMIVRGEIPYIRVVKDIPREMRDKLPQEYLSIIETSAHPSRATPQSRIRAIALVPSQVQRTISAIESSTPLISFYQKTRTSKYDSPVPSTTVSSSSNPLPVEIYPSIKRLQSLLGFSFEYQTRTGKRKAFDLPEIQLMALIVISTKLHFPFDDIKRYPSSAQEPTTQTINWNTWIQAQRDFDRHETSGGKLGKGNEIQLKEDKVFDMTPSQLDEYMDWYENSWLDISKAKNPLADLFPTNPGAGENQPSAAAAAAASIPAPATSAEEDENEAMSTMVQTVTSQLKSRRVIDDGNAHVPRPGTSYPRYRMESNLSEAARPFYETAAKVVGVSLITLSRAVYHAETRISRWLEDQRRVGYFVDHSEMDVADDDDNSDAAEEIDDHSMADVES
ncbi:uncharacterized protein KD926_003841 [Aspergillus affinis]|uniref:uncharacterized protein n=1 Tax=Aspergillus affinis TaxID=1070780 RepID=UPI0022FE6FB0|nr:uncharacterized protein KD926_003841 [Aspergillus affinis]KAI9043311.1 hypothetical protein KD926_003841 [Aspergillus affinis]